MAAGQPQLDRSSDQGALALVLGDQPLGAAGVPVEEAAVEGDHRGQDLALVGAGVRDLELDLVEEGAGGLGVAPGRAADGQEEPRPAAHAEVRGLVRDGEGCLGLAGDVLGLGAVAGHPGSLDPGPADPLGEADAVCEGEPGGEVGVRRVGGVQLELDQAAIDERDRGHPAVAEGLEERRGSVEAGQGALEVGGIVQQRRVVDERPGLAADRPAGGLQRQRPLEALEGLVQRALGVAGPGDVYHRVALRLGAGAQLQRGLRGREVLGQAALGEVDLGLDQERLGRERRPRLARERDRAPGVLEGLGVAAGQIAGAGAGRQRARQQLGVAGAAGGVDPGVGHLVEHLQGPRVAEEAVKRQGRARGVGGTGDQGALHHGEQVAALEAQRRQRRRGAGALALRGPALTAGDEVAGVIELRALEGLVVEVLLGVIADALEQGEARLVAVPGGSEQRAVEQGLQGGEAAARGRAEHGLRGVDGEAAAEDGAGREQALRGGLEALPGLVDRGAQRELAARQVAEVALEQVEAAVEALEQGLGGQEPGASRGELDGEGEPVEASDELALEGLLLRVGVPAGAGCTGAGLEQGQRLALRQRRDLEDLLAGDTHELAAGDQEDGPRREVQPRAGRHGDRVQGALGVVEHQEDPVAAGQGLAQLAGRALGAGGGERDLEGVGDGAEQLQGGAGGAEIAEPGPSGVAGLQPGACEAAGEAGLPDPGGPQERDHARARGDAGVEVDEGARAADEGGALRGQVGGRVAQEGDYTPIETPSRHVSRHSGTQRAGDARHGGHLGAPSHRHSAC